MSFNRKRETARLDAYAAANATKIAEIEAIVRKSGCPDHALDDLAHMASESISSAEMEAVSNWVSEAINNQGFARQIAFVMQENGIADATRDIQAAVIEAGPAIRIPV